MNTTEAMKFLATAGQFDPTVWPAQAPQRELKAAVWAEALEDVPLKWAVDHLGNHYRQATRSITVSDLYVGYLNREGQEGKFTTCNSIIVAPKHDMDGRYEVWCRRCMTSVHADTFELAQIMQSEHTQSPDPGRDWSEPQQLPPDDLTDRSRTCPVCDAKPGETCRHPDGPAEFQALNHIERNPTSALKARQHQEWEDKIDAGQSAKCECCGADADPAGAYWATIGEPKPAELSVACPWCKARTHQRCTRADSHGQHNLNRFHPSRTEALTRPVSAVVPAQTPHPAI